MMGIIFIIQNNSKRRFEQRVCSSRMLLKVGLRRHLPGRANSYVVCDITQGQLLLVANVKCKKLDMDNNWCICIGIIHNNGLNRRNSKRWLNSNSKGKTIKRMVKTSSCGSPASFRSQQGWTWPLWLEKTKKKCFFSIERRVHYYFAGLNAAAGAWNNELLLILNEK